MDQAIEDLRMIQEIIGADTDLVRIAADQVLLNIPSELKGPEWSDAGLPAQILELERAPLLEQLKKGRVAYPATDLAANLPPGWIRPEADVLIELPLRAIVDAMPTGELRGAERVDDETMAASSMRDYFQRPTPEPEPAPIPEPVPEPEATIPEDPVPTEWPDTGIPLPASTEPETGSEPAELPTPPPVEPAAQDVPAPPAPEQIDGPVSPVLPVAEPLPLQIPVPETEAPVAAFSGPAAPVESAPTVAQPLPTSPEAIEPVGTPPVESQPSQPPKEPQIDLDAATVVMPAAAAMADARQVVAADLTPKAESDRVPSGWDGVERKLDASARAVDLNTVSASVLETLPGVGSFRAQLLVEYRKQNGPLGGIYDLLRIQGIGRRLFQQITGLRPIYKNRRDRHEVLNELLGLSPDERPSLGQIMDTACRVLGADASILSGADGVMLAQTGLDSLAADRYAAFTPNFFRKTRRYWPILGVEGVQQVILPGAHPRALLHNGGGFSWVLLVQEGKDWNQLMARAADIAEEINWLFSPHAVVRQVEAALSAAQEPAP